MGKIKNETYKFPEILGIKPIKNRRLIWLLRSIKYTAIIFATLLAMCIMVIFIRGFVTLSLENMVTIITNLIHSINSEGFRLLLSIMYICCMIVSLMITYGEPDDTYPY